MIRFLTIFVFALCSLPAVALTADRGPPSAAQDASAQDAAAMPSADATVAPSDAQAPPEPGDLANPDAPVSTDDVVDRGRDAAGAVGRAISEPTLLSIMGAIAAGLWAIIAAIRRFGGVYLSGTATRWITLIGAPIATFLGAFATGMGWFESLILAGGGPGALLLNELLRAFGTGDASLPRRASGGASG